MAVGELERTTLPALVTAKQDQDDGQNKRGASQTANHTPDDLGRIEGGGPCDLGFARSGGLCACG